MVSSNDFNILRLRLEEASKIVTVRERENWEKSLKKTNLFVLFLFQSSIISKEQRQFNENIFHELRASKSPYDFCKYLLGNLFIISLLFKVYK
jgi:hypothetical protein